MAPIGIQNFYYTRVLPSRSVAIAQISAVQTAPSDLVDVLNTPLFTGALGVWTSPGPFVGPPAFVVGDYNQAVSISGNTSYYLDNQFFQITSQFAADGSPLFYAHRIPSGAAAVQLLDSTGAVVAASILFDAATGTIYHDQPLTDAHGGVYQVRYASSTGIITVGMLHYDLAMVPNSWYSSPDTYVLVGRSLQVPSMGIYSIRFLQSNGYQVLVPYNTPSYLPWYPRVRFPISTPEYAGQLWIPAKPYMLGSWVRGTVINSHLVQFDCPNAYTVLQKPFPDIVVFDQNFAIKYAMDGTSVTTASGNASLTFRGTLYPWRRQQIIDFDPTTARAAVIPELASTDNVYAFYPHIEPDLLYTSIDVNPVTNPSIKNCSVQFYYRTDSSPYQRVFHQVFDGTGNLVAGQTNDPTPPNWTTSPPSVFGQLIVGASFGTSSFTVTDARVRGGGLAPQYQNLPVADHFWDIGYLDGRPYPIGAALVVYLPTRILETMIKSLVIAKVQAVLPMGVLAVVRFYDADGNESV